MRRRTALLALPAAALARPALAFPDRPVQLWVGFAPGGNVDIAARLMAPFLEAQLGAPVQVVNKPGAAGMLMLNELAAARADGHVAGLASFPALVTALADSTPRYRLDSFLYAGQLTDEPYTLYVAPNAPWRTAAELVAAARAAPERISMAGAAGTPQLAVREVERAAGVRFTWVPMAGASQAMTLVQGGHADASVSTVSLTVGPWRQGQVRLLGLMDRERWARAPDVPTLAEQGIDAVAGSARGVVLPAGVEESVAARWEAAVAAIARDPGFAAVAERENVIVRPLDRRAMTAMAAAEAARYAALWRSAPWK